MIDDKKCQIISVSSFLVFTSIEARVLFLISVHVPSRCKSVSASAKEARLLGENR